jgi:polysaccharide chain length determinant protein (PEP-CTERM system associated)
MQEILDQIIDGIRGSWRFRRYALLTAWIIAPIGWAVVFLLPDVYQANSRVFVDTKTALKPVLENLVLDQDVNAQLNLVRQALLAGPQLDPVAQEVGLIDARTMSPQRRLRVVNYMRDRITLNVTLAGQGGEGQERDAGSIYAIQYKDVSRDRAIKVVEILQNNLIENTLGGKRSGSENAQKFLVDQIRDYEQRLRTAEDQLASFKKQNVGLMPAEQQGGGGSYFARLQMEMDAVKTAQSQLAITTSRREELQRQLRGEAPVAAASGLAMPNTHGGAVGAADTLSRIQETQARLDDLLLRFTDKHPDVIATRETLEALRLRRQAELDALRRGDPNAAAASGASLNPVYQSIQLALNQADVEIASLRRQIADRQTKVAELRAMLDTMPQVEAEYARLNRDYDVTKAQYTALVERLEKSRLGEEAATSGSVRFDVIEPPNAEFKPISPMRSVLLAAVLAVSLAAGAAVAFMLHQLKPVFVSMRALADYTGLQVLGAVSMTSMAQYEQQMKRSFWRYGAAVVALVILGVVVLQLSRMGVRLAPQAGT